MDSEQQGSGGVRRHHTISAHSRSARAASKDFISEEALDNPIQWNNDEVVDQDWVGGVGAVGEKTSLHRQASLPTRYHRGFNNQGTRSGTATPKTVNSLAAIAGNEGEEEPWRYAAYNVDDDESQPDPLTPQHPQVIDAQNQAGNPPLSPHFGGTPPVVPSPPPAGSGVRRHVSLTYGAAMGSARKAGNAGLKRSGTLQAAVPHHAQNSATPPDHSDHVEEEDYTYDHHEENNALSYEDEYYLTQHQQQQQQQYGTANIGRTSPWSNNSNTSTGAADWRGFNGSNPIDDVSRALSTLELASNQPPQIAGHGGYAFQHSSGQNVHPPRFNPAHGPPPPHSHYQPRVSNGNRLPGNDYHDGRKTPQSQRQWDQQQQQQQQPPHTLRGQRSNSNLQYGNAGGGGAGAGGQHSKNPSAASGGNSPIPSVPPIPQQYLQQPPNNNAGNGNGNGRPGLGVSTSFPNAQPNIMPSGQTPVQGFVNTPIDVPSLIASKGYNPSTFDTRPTFARYFVIKSYTEDDVHKSLKYEIWSSTDPGNKRLDKAFKDTAGRGPIYLFFSVNASGHFCGMAEMLTPVDYTRSSTVWASDKWKGVFKVRWIFVRDIPNITLRHIKLNNTAERKPVTNSRDTQELLPEAGQEMLRIFHTHPARTSLLQDFAFYELQAMQKMQAAANANVSGSNSNSSTTTLPLTATNTGTSSTSTSTTSTSNTSASPSMVYLPPGAASATSPASFQNLNNNVLLGGGGGGASYTSLGMGGMGMANMGGMGMGAGLHPHHGHGSQAMHQSVMRNPSPGPGVQQGGGGIQQGQGQGVYGGY